MEKMLTLKKSVAKFGEDIGLEEGAKMINAYESSVEVKMQPQMIGREILTAILAQPNCQGIKFFSGLNEAGEIKLVYIGIDASGKEILSITEINNEGSLVNRPAIVADRAEKPRNDDGIGFWEF